MNICFRRAEDEKQFLEAGRAKPRKTYEYDPTKPIAIKKSAFKKKSF